MFIGLGAFALAVETYIISNHSINYPLCLLIGLATIVFYGLHRLIQIKKYSRVNSIRMQVLRRYRLIITSSVFVSFLLSVGIVAVYYLSYWWLWLGLAIASSLYLIPLLNKNKRVRDIPYLKIWAIAISWPLITVGLPYLIDGVNDTLSIYLFFERFLFFILITLPFDIRDRTEDQAIGLKTLATSMSRDSFNRIGLFAFLLESLIIWIAPFEFSYACVLQLLALAGIFYLWRSNEKKDLWYFSFLIDGLIVMRVVLLLFIGIFT